MPFINKEISVSISKFAWRKTTNATDNKMHWNISKIFNFTESRTWVSSEIMWLSIVNYHGKYAVTNDFAKMTFSVIEW